VPRGAQNGTQRDHEEMSTPTNPNPDRREIAPEADQSEVSPRLITAARLILLVLLLILAIELAL
jgi:hypothetical protein